MERCLLCSTAAHRVGLFCRSSVSFIWRQPASWYVRQWRSEWPWPMADCEPTDTWCFQSGRWKAGWRDKRDWRWMDGSLIGGCPAVIPAAVHPHQRLWRLGTASWNRTSATSKQQQHHQGPSIYVRYTSIMASFRTLSIPLDFVKCLRACSVDKVRPMQ
jgi:hypothetical protein